MELNTANIKVTNANTTVKTLEPLAISKPSNSGLEPIVVFLHRPRSIESIVVHWSTEIARVTHMKARKDEKE